MDSYGSPPSGESSFLLLVAAVSSLGHYNKLVDIAKSRDVDQPVNRELSFFFNTAPAPIYLSILRSHCSLMNNTPRYLNSSTSTGFRSATGKPSQISLLLQLDGSIYHQCPPSGSEITTTTGNLQLQLQLLAAASAVWMQNIFHLDSVSPASLGMVLKFCWRWKFKS